MLSFFKILSKLDAMNDPKVDQLCVFIRNRVWCYGPPTWETFLPDLELQLQTFTNCELINLGFKLLEIDDPDLHFLLIWVIMSNPCFCDLVGCENLTPEEEALRQTFKDTIVLSKTLKHAVVNLGNECLLQEALTTLEAIENPTNDDLKLIARIQEKLGI